MQAVIGSRNIKYFDFTKLNLTNVISGGAAGVDSLVKDFCDANGIPIEVIPPDYKTHGRAATFIRNRKIVDRADIIHAIWDGKSPGTKSVIDYATRKGKPIMIH